MTEIKLQGNPVHTSGSLPAKGTAAPAFELVKPDLSPVSLADYRGKKKVLNVFPSLDTAVCATSVRTFNEKAAGRNGVAVLNISMDLPFAHGRFCGAEGIEDAEALSGFRSSFGADFGLDIVDGPMAGLYSRAVIVLDENDRVIYTQQVPEITDEPDYEASLAALD